MEHAEALAELAKSKELEHALNDHDAIESMLRQQQKDQKDVVSYLKKEIEKKDMELGALMDKYVMLREEKDAYEMRLASDREKALAAGCDDYDSKPIDLKRLLAKIDARRAEAFKEEDQRMILGAVEKGVGFTKLNQVVAMQMQASQTKRQALDRERPLKWQTMRPLIAVSRLPIPRVA